MSPLGVLAVKLMIYVDGQARRHPPLQVFKGVEGLQVILFLDPC